MQSSARMTPKSVCNSVDESYIYKKNKSIQKGLSVKGFSALAAIKTATKIDENESTNKKAIKKQGIENSEVFTVETVSGEPITNLDVINATKLVFFYSGKKYDKGIAKMMVPAVIESLEDDKLREQCAKAFGLRVSKDEIDKEIARLAEMNGISVQELKKQFEGSGISEETLRKSIESRIIFQMMAQSLADDDKISNKELEVVKREQQALLNSERYFVIEIFRYQKESATKILQWAHEGFDFSALAENFSQAIKAGQRGTPRWIRAKAIEQEVLSQLKKMKPGELSDVIKTKSGYKIIALIDAAEPGKAGRSDSSYRIIQTSIPYRGKLFTQSDSKKAKEVIGQLMKTENKTDFKRICETNKLKCEEIDMQRPSAYYRELINQSKDSKKPAAMQSPEQEGIVIIVLFLEEKTEKAKLPSPEKLKQIASEQKTDDMYTRSFKKIKSMVHVEKNLANIKRLAQ